MRRGSKEGPGTREFRPSEDERPLDHRPDTYPNTLVLKEVLPLSTKGPKT